MPTMRPSDKPEAQRDFIESLLHEAGVTDKVALVGRRGYYRDSMGVKGKNDRGIYDDAIFVVSPNLFAAYNANTDPSRGRPGMAVLKPGVWRYKIGVHGLSKPKAQQYKALVQAAEVVVVRDGRGDDRGYFGINIHRGGNTTTGSEGCQTIVPDQWASFIATVEAEMKEFGQTSLPYLLSDRGDA